MAAPDARMSEAKSARRGHQTTTPNLLYLSFYKSRAVGVDASGGVNRELTDKIIVHFCTL